MVAVWQTPSSKDGYCFDPDFQVGEFLYFDPLDILDFIPPRLNLIILWFSIDMSSPEHVNITCIPHQSSLYLQSPPDSKKQKLNRDPKARRSSRYLCLVLRFLYFFSLRFHHHCVHYRHRKQRGEVSLTVGSSETLRDVKVQVKQIFFLITYPRGTGTWINFAGYVPLRTPTHCILFCGQL